MKNTLSKSIALITLSAGIGCHGMAQASEANLQVESRAVSYADLNLARPADQKIMHQRIRNAARDVCDLDTARRIPARQARAGKACYQNAIADAIASVPTHASAVAKAN